MSAARLLSLALVLATGCGMVRAPASAMSRTIPIHDGVAEPQLELWVEGHGELPPAELALARAEALSSLRVAQALWPALDDRRLLVLRAQAVSVTPHRRSALAAYRDGLQFGHYNLGVFVALVDQVNCWGHAGGFGRSSLLGPRRAGPDAAMEELELATLQDASTPRAQVLWLEPPPRLDPTSRWCSSPDFLRLELLLVDRRDGSIQAQKAVTRKVDVRDGLAVRALVAAALDEPSGWAPPQGVARTP